MPSKILFQHRIYRRDLQANPDVLYVFGDNEARVGYGGQAAECRDEPNAVGIATKVNPGTFWTEADTERQKAVVDADMKRLFDHPGVIVWPLDNIGTGLSELPERAPDTYVHIIRQLIILAETCDA